MRKIALILSMLTVAICYAFLYFGSVYPSFSSGTPAKILAITFEVAFILSTILLIMIFKKNNKFYLFLVMASLAIFLIHLVLLVTIGFQPIYSYGMDVIISAVYLLIVANNWEIFLEKK